MYQRKVDVDSMLDAVKSVLADVSTKEVEHALTKG